MNSPTSIYRLESNVRAYCRECDVVFATASGATLTDIDGLRYIDFFAGAGSLNYGHNNPYLKKHLLAYIEQDGVTTTLDFHSDAKSRFIERFEQVILKPRGLDYKLQFTGPTGTNTVEAALKLARKVTGRQNVIAFTNGFHGMTLGALACTGNAGKRGGAGVPLSHVSHEPFDGYFGTDVDTAALLEQRLSDPSSGLDKPAAILIESVQGEGGLNVASAPWLRKIADLAKRHGALLILDDIQAGCGRTGNFFSFEEAGIKPDIVTLAKSLSGMGLPFALTLIKPELDQWKPGEHNGTFRGNNHAFITAAAAFRHFWRDDRFASDVKAKGDFLAERLAEIAAPYGDEFRLKGRGMMRGIDVGSGDLADRITSAAFDRGLIVETSGPHDEVVKILAPLTISRQELATGLDLLEQCVTAAMSRPYSAAAE